MKETEIIEQTVGNGNICVAILDGPVDLTHPCFNNAKLTQLETLVSGVSDDGPSANHGTHVASLIFGQHASPIHGISPGCRGLIVPVFGDGSDGSVAPCSQIDLAHGITQAVEQGAHVINISGGELVSFGEPHPLLDKAARLCTENNVLIVAAVGNDGCPCIHIPAALSSTLAVGAMDTHGLPLDFSNWGKTYQDNGILALGDKIVGAVPGGGVTTKSGSSFATPIVSGIIALLLSIQIQRGDKPNPFSVREAILQSAHPCLPSEGLNCSRYLRGRLNIEGAYNFIKKRQHDMADINNSVLQIRGNAGIGLMESPKKLPAFGVHNAEFAILNPEIKNSSIQYSISESLKAPENLDSINLKSTDIEKNEQNKNQVQEIRMTELIDKACDCLKEHAKGEEINEPKNPTSSGTGIIISQDNASNIREVESTITNQEITTPAVMLSEVQSAECSNGGEQPLVYALGKLGYDFGSEARRDSFIQSMEGNLPNPDDLVQLLTHLEKNPEYAESLIWTLEIEDNPVYAIHPKGGFASLTYNQLCEFLKEQQTEGVEMVSIPGVIAGKARLLSGQIVPVIIPELRGMNSWTIKVLLKAVIDMPLKDTDDKKQIEVYSKKESGVLNFLQRVYYELRNLGRASSDRAINFAGTNAFQPSSVIEQMVLENMALDKIETERSLICRPYSDCWDVKLTFFDPANRLTVARRVFRFTVDVSDVVPVTVGKIRSWSVY